MRFSRQYQVGAFGGLLSLAISATFLRLGFSEVEGRFLPDDTYYTLTIARNIFEGRGPSMDGIIPTSGFQPLIALFELPLFAFFTRPETLTIGAIAISTVFGAIAAALAGMLVQREIQTVWAGLLAGALVAVSPAISGNALNGLETSLAAALMLWLLWLVQGSDRFGTTRRAAMIGLVAGGTMLARIDSIFLLLPAGLWGLRHLGPGRAAVVAGVAALTFAPWMLYCLRFGMPVPESGAAVRQIVQFHQAVGTLSPSATLTHVAGAFGLFLDARSPLFGVAVVLATLLAALVRHIRTRQMSLGMVLTVSALLYLGFYTLYLPAFWFFDRYLNPVFIFTAILLALELATRAGKKAACRGCRVAAIVASGSLVLYAAIAQFQSLSSAAGQLPGRGYAAQANSVLERLPDDAVLTAMQSGALSWWAGFPPYAQRRIRVVNLDGVVNQDAKNAIHDHRLAAYLQSIRATHFADWHINVLMLTLYSGQEPPSLLKERIFQSPTVNGFDIYLLSKAQDGLG